MANIIYEPTFSSAIVEISGKACEDSFKRLTTRLQITLYNFDSTLLDMSYDKDIFKLVFKVSTKDISESKLKSLKSLCEKGEELKTTFSLDEIRIAVGIEKEWYSNIPDFLVKIYKPDSDDLMTNEELAKWAGPAFRSVDFPYLRLSGTHCRCGENANGLTKGIFELLPQNNSMVIESGKAFMKCRVCGEFSHL
jgi:hypothetical protein